MNDTRNPGAGSSHAPLGGHDHRHDRWCGHPALDHGDHVDFLHDGRAHRPCADHVEALPDCDEPLQTIHVPHGAHMHVHQADCGHATVNHLDHVDYIHGLHRHAAHQTHYDEH